MLIVFGWNAYRVAARAVDAQEAGIILDNATHLAAVLSRAYGKSKSLSRIEEALASHSINENYLSIITDRAGQPVVDKELTTLFDVDINRFPKGELLNPDNLKGKVRIDDMHYGWVHVPVSNSPYNLLHIYKCDYEDIDPLSGLAFGMVAVALIILWFALWAALILSTQISRKFRSQTEALEYQSTHDALTGLPNRALLHKDLENQIGESLKDGKSLALIMLDLDRFKEINDTLGHDNGDALLKEIGISLNSVLWKFDSIARMGGDEFALMLPISNASHCDIVINKIQRVMSQPFVLDGMSLEIGASLGVAVFPNHAKDASNLIRCAEIAMYIAKENGESCVYYDAERDPHSLKRLKLSSDLRLAAEKNQFSLYYQPKMEMASCQIKGVEALIRWNHPEYGFVPPDEFIPLAEQSGAIKPITEWVLSTAIKQCAEWNIQGIPLAVSVNLSARSLHDAELTKQIAMLLKANGLPAFQLELEITETAIMMDPDRALDILGKLSSMGIKLSIDDFGTGYTSLSYLKRLPVDEIKIDKSFVMDMVEDHDNAIIVQSIVSLAHSMGRSVIAEGVESKAIIDELLKLNCDTIQGYFLSRPVAPEDFVKWLQSDDVSDEPELKYQAL